MISTDSFSPPWSWVRASPIASRLDTEGDSAASFLTYAENTQDAVLIGGKEKVSVWTQDFSATLQTLIDYVLHLE